MFEFHGWACLNFRSDDEEGFVDLIRWLRVLLASLASCHQFFHLNDGFNGQYSLTVSGLRNHRQEEVIDVFRWLAENAPSAYGLLYVHDGEDNREGDYDYNSEFSVFRLLPGRLDELQDAYFVPFGDQVVPSRPDDQDYLESFGMPQI